ncbi:MAG: tetratricopeptide repeat protein [Balneolaceae bacterium]
MKIILLILFGFLISASAANDARKANEAFRNGDYETAAQLYQAAIEENPDDARLHFNLGNALSKMGMTDEAMESFENFKSLSEDSQERSKADYNTGTMLSESEMYDEAAKFFKNSLKENPTDPDAKHNYELALRKQQEQEQEQEEQSEDQNEGEDDQENEDQQGEDNQDEGDQEQEQDQNQDQGEGEQEQDDQQSQPEPQDLSEEEAESILNALEQLERELLEGQKKEASENRSSNDKDW